ncbi:Ig-like domain-containing protein [Marinobacterium sedimentorum]|uniref:Ig-like domain-containing protein n=1 Tax=Marinobacterium sedimentorum TaxID=2927804 RepID=UPI0020C5C5AE|nr:Ig-like domain-containing protein [Marinobacterium sedimentorum]MCP8690058.1 Ig-like domain-containing protein [Marinobacterium sedimentorum]
MNSTRYTPLAGCLLTLVLSCSAQGGFEPISGAGIGGNADNLPPGRLKSQIERLPPAAQQRALEWLERFDIPAQDFDFLRVDPQGAIFYEDTVLPDDASGDPDAPVGGPEAVAPADTFLLHSRPGASKQVFLDFDGAQISGTAWNNGGNTLYARPFDTDGSPYSFSDSERNRIAEIWHRVSEDMAPFDIDVTTEDPGSFGPTTGHVLITDSTDETGAAMPSQNAGGVAYVGVWGTSYYSSYQPALVYTDHLGPDYPPYIAEAASHEFGHNLGLGHDGTSTVGYYSGHGSGYVSWAPIMGVGYYTNVTQWSKGEYPDANNTQDDLAIISGKLGYRPDDHSNAMAAATPLVVDPDGTIYVSFPEIDPFNSDPANKGVIETRSDVDTFWFDSAAGQVTFNVLPAWEAFYRTSLRGANLDIQASLYDALGNLVASSDPLNDTMAQLDEFLPAGRYYLQVAGVGNALSPYSDYGSLGMYFISGTVQPASADTTPPTPSPMQWQQAPAPVSASSIQMTAVTAQDESGVVQYLFECVLGSCSSGWQSSAYFLATGLTPNTTYSFHARARDAAGNETVWSSTLAATTQSNALPVANDDAVATDEDQALSVAVLANDSDADGDILSIAGYGQGSNGSVAQNGSNLVYTPAADFSGSDSFAYTLTDGNGGSATATVTVTVNPVNDAPVAFSDSAEVALNSSVVIDVLANDIDADGDSLSILNFSQGSKGSVSQSGNNLVYTRDNKRGGDSFSYTVIDGNGGSATTTVSVSLGSSGGGGSGGGNCNPKKGC